MEKKKELTEFEKETLKNKQNLRRKLLDISDEIENDFAFYNFTDYRIDGVLLYFCPKQQTYNDINVMINANYENLPLKLMKSKFKLRFLDKYAYTFIYDIEKTDSYNIYKGLIRKYQDEVIAKRTNSEVVVENSNVEDLLTSLGVELPKELKEDKKTFKLLKGDISVKMTNEEAMEALNNAKTEYEEIMLRNTNTAYSYLVQDLIDCGFTKDENFKTLIESTPNLVIAVAPIPEPQEMVDEFQPDNRMNEYVPQDPIKLNLKTELSHPLNCKNFNEYIVDFILNNKTDKRLINNVYHPSDLIALLLKNKKEIINYPVQNNIIPENENIDDFENEYQSQAIGIVSVNDDEIIISNGIDFNPPLSFTLFINGQGMLECKNIKEYSCSDKDGGLTDFICTAFDINSKIYKKKFNELMLHLVQNFDKLKVKRYNKLDKILNFLDSQDAKEKENQGKSWFKNGSNTLNFYYFSIVNITDDVCEVLIHYASTFNNDKKLDNQKLPEEILEALNSINIEAMKNSNNKFVSKTNKRVTHTLLSDLGFTFNFEFNMFHEKN